MRKLRGLFFSLGLAAMSVLMANAAHAETLTLSVYAGTDTTVPAIYSVVGTAQGVSANTGILNSDLAGAGFGAYSFTSLGGSSNNPGSAATGPLGGAYIITSGNLVVLHGLSGESTPITVVLTEGGFSLPTSSPSLTDTAQANVAGVTGTQDSTGVLTPATGSAVITPTATVSGTGSATTSAIPGLYVTPFSLDSQTTLNYDTVSSTNGSIGFSQKVQLVAAATVPEPASLLMMLTGMPLPLVVLGLLRRRRAAS